MDSFEASTIVFSRIRKLEPENVTNKIIGYLLLQDCQQEMIRLAFGPDTLIHTLIHKIKIQLGLVSKPAISPPISPSMNNFTQFSPLSSPTPLRIPNPYLEMNNPRFIPVSVHEDFGFQNPTQFVGLEDRLGPVNLGIPAFSSDYYCPEGTFARSQLSPTVSEFPIKVCHYYNKGFCKHGSSCRYFHGQPFPDGFYQLFSPGSNEVVSEDHVLSPGSLEKLEFEITELLKSRRGNPVSIASLPMLYYEMYGRTLQAEGYLTESQRHGKVGYSLTKLLARLKNSIRLIDSCRPHGQHSVILAEDAPKYMENWCERNDPGPIVSGSRQIYLTFPAESTFTEEDVSDYFNTFGPVQDVRIPCQQRRMFGFVTFVSADTVKMILSRGNPHYVCGARVLVKPYREKSKLFDRKYLENFELQRNHNTHYADMDSEFLSRWESSRLLQKPFMEDYEQGLEVQARRLSDLQLARKPLANQSCFGYSMDVLNASEDHSKFPSSERFNYLLDVLNNDPNADDIPKYTRTNHTDQTSSEGVHLSERAHSHQHQ
ncbi:zinc finger CCCH domain-containing protein 18-like isoform X1 [Actinidia eriantha]|uniref:zinc finger CCCH domain-containing protein 18-like isoform X1 n=1 Tax=Actinidia eriantha TaxID=165200 RepID=UPI0025845ED2|nr:zinc finger CCCH domain-containing protein 18-like isoform X1 [Actinidia eriantha]XP_057486346.1 zinc finger CCCH domain-containing protein 18-like isoform X1 [Actinidia eriantha]